MSLPLCSDAAVMRRDMRSAILSREDIPPETMHAAHFAAFGLDVELVVEILTHMAGELDVPVTKLRPSDRFDVEVAPDWWSGWDSGVAILLLDLTSMAKRRGVRIEQGIATVDDYIRVMAAMYC